MFGSENRLRSFEPQKLIQTSMEGFWVVRTKDASIFDVNEAFCNMVGYSRDELLTMCVSDLEVDESPAETAARIKKIMASGYDRFETRHRHKQGHLIDLEISVSYTELDGGTNYVFARDISERKRLEQAIVTREQEFRSMAESSPDFIVRYDREGRHLYLNDRLLKLLGLSSMEEVIGKRPSEVWEDGRFAELEQAAVRAVESGSQVDIELVQPTESGAFRYDQIFIVPERDVSGQVVGTIAFGREITAIRKTSRKLMRFIENLPGIAYTFRLSPDGHACFPFISPSIEKFYGLKPEDVQDDIAPLHSFWHPADRTRIEAAAAESALTMTPFHIESRVCRPGQPECWFEARALPEREADGSILWHGLMLDITDRKQMEEALRAREQEFRQLAERSPDVIVRYDSELRRIYINPAWEAANGIVIEEALGKRVSEIAGVVSGIEQEFEAKLRKVLESGEPSEIEFGGKGRVGNTKYLSMRVVPEYGKDGKVASLLTVANDITERKQAERNLRESENRFRTLFESASDCMLILDMDGRIIDINHSGYEGLGYQKQEMLGRRIGEFDTPEFAFLAPAHMAKIEEEGKVMFESAHVRKDGTIMPIEINIRTIQLGGERRYFSVIRDITERKRMEEERQGYLYFFKSMDRINRVIQGSNDMDTVLNEVLDTVLAIFDCDRAFLVYPCDPDTAEWRVQLERTKPEYPGALVLGAAVAMDKEAMQMSRIMLGADGPVTFGPEAEYPLPRYLSAQYSVKSQMSMVLHLKLDNPWHFGIHQCSHSRVWSDADERLLHEIGRRLTDALTTLSAYRNLLASEQKFRSLAENMPDTLIRYDREGRRTYINPALKRISAVRDEQMVGLTQQEANPFAMPETYRLALEHTLATGERSELELPISTPSGDIRTNLVSIVPERAADGKISGAITIGHDITERKQAEQQLRELTAHLQTVREEEKARLAREIHDDLGSTLAALKFKMHLLLDVDVAEDMKKMPLFARLESMLPLLESAIESTRRIITDMRPDVLDNLGLFAALKWQAVQFQKRTGITCRIFCANDHDCEDCNWCECQLDKALSINLFRIFQEALTNVARHSGASSVVAEYRPGSDQVFLSIIDNGCGFPEGHSPASSSFGIRDMRERVGQLGGQIEFNSPLGGGFSVIVRLPRHAVSQ